MNAIVDWFERSEDYLSALDAMATTGQRHPAFLRKGIEQLLDRQRGAASLLQRNALLLDAARLMRNQWRRPEAGKRAGIPEELDRQVLEQEAAALNGPAADAVVEPISQRLIDTLRQATKDTFPSFEAFESGDKCTFDARTELDSFSTWFAKYLPLLLTQLPEHSGPAEVELSSRICSMVIRLHDPELALDDPALVEVRSAYVAAAWDYVREHVKFTDLKG